MPQNATINIRTHRCNTEGIYGHIYESWPMSTLIDRQRHLTLVINVRLCYCVAWRGLTRLSLAFAFVTRSTSIYIQRMNIYTYALRIEIVIGEKQKSNINNNDEYIRNVALI